MGHRASATARRAKLRKGASARWLTEVVACWLKLVGAVQGNDSGFGLFVSLFVGGQARSSSRHCGDLVPIPPVDVDLISAVLPAVGLLTNDLATLVNFSLAGVNFLYGGARDICIPPRASAV